MYELVGSICLGRTIGAQWETPDLQDVLMTNVLFNFSRVYLQLKHPSQEQLLVADLNPLRTELSTNSKARSPMDSNHFSTVLG
jgi:hypothetical protein